MFVNRRYVGSGRNAVIREEDAGRLAAEHMLELGHTRLAHIAGPAEIDTARRRSVGFVEAVRAAGHRATVVAVPFDERQRPRRHAEACRRRNPPTGVFASNINQAIGALAGARLAGVTVGREVSLIGYDEAPLCECLMLP